MVTGRKAQRAFKKAVLLFLMENAITSVPAGAAAEEFFIKPFQEDPDITQLGMSVQVSTKTNKLYFNSQLDKITKKKTGCGWDYVGGANMSSKTMTPIELAAAIEQCYTVFMDTYFSDGLPAGAARGELSPEIQVILLDLFNNAYKRDVLTKLFLGDTALSDDYYNELNGVYKKLSTDANVPSIGEITDEMLEPENIEATFYSVYDKQKRLLRSLPNSSKKFWVTGKVYDAFIRFVQLKTQTSAGVMQRESIIEGFSDGRYNGIEIVPIRIVDERLELDFTEGSPALPENPNRIILTQPDNHVLKLDKASFGDARMWYSQDDDKFRIAGSSTIAYEYKYSELNVIGGF